MIALIMLVTAPGVFAADPASAVDPIKANAIMAECRKAYPNTEFKAISATPFPGVYELQMDRNIAYIEETCRYMLFGHIYDMETQTDLTAARLPSPNPSHTGPVGSKVNFSALPKGDAIVTIRGDGSRKIAVFSDPDCPYCKRLEQDIRAISNITIYTFLFPIDQLHPQAKVKSIGVWCAENQNEAWEKLMLEGIVTDGDCKNPIERNIALAESLGINGTPSIILEDGTLIPGAIPASRLESALSQGSKIVKK